METTNTYPRNNIDPKDKNIEWGKQYAKAVWHDWNFSIPRTVFFNAADKYEELRLYAMGKQPIQKYKKLMGVDEQTNNTWLNIDWSVRPIITKYRDIAISRLMQQEYGIVGTAIDPTAKAELDQLYAQMKAKIAVRQLLQQQNPELANHPMLQPAPGDPMDFDEMEMRIQYGEQFNRAKDAEQAIQLGMYENKSDLFRKKLFENFFDCGIAGYKEWLGEDNKPKFREVNPEAVVTNYCRYSDFRDLIHAGEVIDVSLVDLATMGLFTDEQLQTLANDVAGKWSNPSMVGRSTNYFKGYDKFKVKVLDLEFFSYNDYVYEQRVNRRGNQVFGRADYKSNNNVKDKYIRKCVKVVYKIKWIIGTELAYDFGLANDMKRSNNPRKKAETSLSYKFFAPNFYEMRALGMMEKLIPLIDDYQLTVYKIQNVKNRIVLNGWWIDLDALENVALNKGGENMKPMDLLTMFMETGVLVGRSQGVMGDNVNYKPIIPIQNSIATELAALYQDLQFTMNQIQTMTGLNDITDGSTPNAKTLVPGYENANLSTNNALQHMSFGEKMLYQQLAQDVLTRTQQGLRKGGIEGYAPALNTNTLMLISLSADLALHEYGIMLEEKPTDDQRQLLIQTLQMDIAQGLLNTSDVFYISNTFNVKQAQMILSYRVEKNRQKMEQSKMAINQQTIQGQQQSALMAEQAKQQTLQMEYELKMRLEHLKIMGQLEVEKIKLGAMAEMNAQTNQTKVATQAMQHHHDQHMQTQELAMTGDGRPTIPASMLE